MAKKAMRRTFRLQRDFDILHARDNGFETPTMIANALGLTYSTVQHTLETYGMIEEYGDKYEYLDISFELAELLDEAGCDADRTVTLIMRALWINGFNTRDKIGRIDEDELDMLVNGHRIHRAGKKATEVFLKWQKGYAEAVSKNAKAVKGKPKTKKTVGKTAVK